MKKSKTQKGITLIALIITIVVLLILAVVTINAIQGDGIIEYAKNAANDYQQAQADEEALLQNYLDVINANNQSSDSETEDVLDPTLNHAGIIPEGGVYYVGINAEGRGTGYYEGYTAKYEAGDNFPETVNTGDTYVYGDYEYKYNTEFSAGLWGTDISINGWHPIRIKNASTLGEILESINGKDITNMDWTFYSIHLTVSPKIPDTVTSMAYTYIGTVIIEAPKIPNSVTNMEGTFSYCTSLTGEIEINANLTYFSECFSYTVEEITITGSCSEETKAALAATATNGNVKY